MTNPIQLADEHWNFIEGVLLEHTRLTMKLYKDAMVHGYKHGWRDCEAQHQTAIGTAEPITIQLGDKDNAKGVRTKPTKK